MKVLLGEALQQVEKAFPNSFVSVQIEASAHNESTMDRPMVWKIYSSSLKEGWTQDHKTFEEALAEAKEMATKAGRSKFVEEASF